MPKVKFKNNGEEKDAQMDAPLKDLTRDWGWPIAYGCEDGLCGTCIVKIVEGSENVTEITDKEKQTLEVMGMNDGEHRLACQCNVKGDIEIEGM